MRPGEAGRREGWRRRGAARRPCPGKGAPLPRFSPSGEGAPQDRGAAERRPQAPRLGFSQRPPPVPLRRGGAGDGGAPGPFSQGAPPPPAEGGARLVPRPAGAEPDWAAGVPVSPPSPNWRSRHMGWARRTTGLKARQGGLRREGQSGGGDVGGASLREAEHEPIRGERAGP